MAAAAADDEQLQQGNPVLLPIFILLALNVARAEKEEVGAPNLSEIVRVTIAREGSGESGDDAQLDSLPPSPSPTSPSYGDATVSLRDRDPTSDICLLTKQPVGGKGTAQEHTGIALTAPIQYAPSTQHDVVWV
ncbi:hypothetical protein B484DRAFT_395361 [Ochromonadaceae sp. CCMP2298]|nr:hypothetical protein B484DRAFT_395361 [Ochromonadaceae sp. CCMP2298]